MSSINIDLPTPVVAPPVRWTSSRGTPNAGAHESAADHAGHAAVDTTTAADTRWPITGKVYALKDGSGYVALASDGHYYKLEASGVGLTLASASGAVDASVVDVNSGPVRSLTRGDRGHAVPVRAYPSRETGAAHAEDRATRAEHAGDAGDPPKPATTDPMRTGARGSVPENPIAKTDRAPPQQSGDTDAARGPADTTHGLITSHPDAAVRSHARVTRHGVVALLR